MNKQGNGTTENAYHPASANAHEELRWMHGYGLGRIELNRGCIDALLREYDEARGATKPRLDAPHCKGHQQFEYDCIECVDAAKPRPEFKPGDRVEYVGGTPIVTPELIGKTGTVAGVTGSGDGIHVEWDDGRYSASFVVIPGNLKHLHEEPWEVAMRGDEVFFAVPCGRVFRLQREVGGWRCYDVPDNGDSSLYGDAETRSLFRDGVWKLAEKPRPESWDTRVYAANGDGVVLQSLKLSLNDIVESYRRSLNEVNAAIEQAQDDATVFPLHVEPGQVATYVVGLGRVTLMTNIHRRTGNKMFHFCTSEENAPLVGMEFTDNEAIAKVIAMLSNLMTQEEK